MPFNSGRPILSDVIPSLPLDQRHAFVRVFRGCPRAILEARAALTGEDVAPARLLVVECGAIFLTATRFGSDRPTIMSVASAGALVPPPSRNERLVGLTDAVLAIVPPAE
jgi:hypothetical protein